MTLKPHEERILAHTLIAGSITIKTATRSLGIAHRYAATALGRLNAHNALQPRGDRRDRARVFILTSHGTDLIRASSGHATVNVALNPDNRKALNA